MCWKGSYRIALQKLGTDAINLFAFQSCIHFETYGACKCLMHVRSNIIFTHSCPSTPTLITVLYAYKISFVCLCVCMCVFFSCVFYYMRHSDALDLQVNPPCQCISVQI